jgi:ATP-binding cassette subfamily F protein 3
LDVLAVLRSKGWAYVKGELGVGRIATTVGELHQQIGQLRPPRRPSFFNMQLPANQRSGELVLRSRDLVVGYPGNDLFATADLELRRTECAALIGPNGSGKSSFLKTILAEIPPRQGEVILGASLQIGYFAQAHEGLNLENSVLDELLAQQNMGLGEARSYLARFLFREDDVYKPIRALSGGERGRLALALLSLQGANFLLLDEPTNHLDIPAQEALQEALQLFGGTILMVTHDRYLVDRLASQVWELRDGRLHVHVGDYQNFLAERAAAQAAAAELPGGSAAQEEVAAAAQNGKPASEQE